MDLRGIEPTPGFRFKFASPDGNTGVPIIEFQIKFKGELEFSTLKTRSRAFRCANTKIYSESGSFGNDKIFKNIPSLEIILKIENRREMTESDCVKIKECEFEYSSSFIIL